MRIKLSNRLAAVAGYIEKGAAVVDVGTDHGFLPVYLAESGLARSIIASDMSAGSLAAARRSAVKYGVADKLTFITAPGLDGVGASMADTVVIAGMGGETIAGILADAPWVSAPGVRLIAQPQTKAPELYAWLLANGYVLRDMKRVRDKGRNYTIIICQG